MTYHIFESSGLQYSWSWKEAGLQTDAPKKKPISKKIFFKEKEESAQYLLTIFPYPTRFNRGELWRVILIALAD